MRQSLQDVISLHSLWTVFEAYQHALVAEKQQIKNNTRSAPRGDQNTRGFHPQEPRPTPQSIQGQSSNSNIRCFKCGEPGHRSTECRKPASRTGKNLLIEDETIEKDVDVRDPIFDDCNGDGDGDGDDEEVLYGDGNTTLIVRKSLLAPKDDSNEDWLRTNIFHTTCTIVERVCKVIIDSGSCENVVSEEVVKKLQLKIDSHPNPYKLSWLKKGSEVTVDRRCLVSFSIGKKIF